MVGIEYVVDYGDRGNEWYSIEDDGGSSPAVLAHRILGDLRERYPGAVIYRCGAPADENDIERMNRGEVILAWEGDGALEGDDGSHACAYIRCTRDLIDWIRENIGASSHAWERWVGSQTPQEFVDCAPGRSVVGAVAEYVDDIMKDKRYLGQHQWVADYLDVREALVSALVDEIERELES